MKEDHKKEKKEWENIDEKDVEELFNIITGRTFFPTRPFRSDEVEPDLIIKWKLPDPQNSRYKNRDDYQSINSFVSVPTRQMETAFELAEKNIMSQMTEKKQNQGNTSVKFRYFQTLEALQQPVKHTTKVNLVTGGSQPLSLFCFDRKSNTLDGFTLYINSIIYCLQQICGLKVRTFLVNTIQDNKDGIFKAFDLIDNVVDLDLGPKKKSQYLYMFINMSIENMLKTASRYRIKKPIDYSLLDFHLNEPTTQDERPVRLHSRYHNDSQRRLEFNNVTRYFKIREANDISTEIIEEAKLSLWDEQKFRSYWQESFLVFSFLKTRIDEAITNEEKIYLYEYNRGKLNPGCEKVLTTIKKRREYYELQKIICNKYGYYVNHDPDLYTEFSMPNKNNKGGFFQKLKSIMAYKNNHITPYGDLSLFNSMERSKLCYLALKSTFKITYMQKHLDMEILCLNNEFQKTGKGSEGQKIQGGLDGTTLIDRWYIFGMFTDILTLRNYYGDVIAHQMLVKISIITYLFAISVPYAMLYILEQLYCSIICLYTSMIESFLFAVTFNIYTMFIEEAEQHFIEMFSDNKESNVFSNEFVGPYIRNVVTDELNQYVQQKGFFVGLRNFACLLVFGVLLGIFGGLFHGCRMFLLAIQGPLYSAQGIYFSLSHLISYSIYLIIGDIFKLILYDKIVAFMIYIKNPSSDTVQRNLKSYFTFYYLLIIELIPIFFFLLFEPLGRNSCYAAACEMEFQYYIYARFLFNIIMMCFNFIKVGFIIFRKAKDVIAQELIDNKKPQVLTFQKKLQNMINSAVEEGNKAPYDQGLTQGIVSIFAYAFYCTQLPAAGIFAFGFMAATYVINRVDLLYSNRRPVNKSEPIITYSEFYRATYAVGVFINIWLNTYSLGYVQRNYTWIISFAPHPLTEESIFLIKVFVTVFLFLLITVIGWLARSLILAFSPKGLIQRQRQKYNQYIHLVSGPSNKASLVENVRPVKTVFRSFNPEKMNYEKLIDELDLIDLTHAEAKIAEHVTAKLLDVYNENGPHGAPHNILELLTKQHTGALEKSAPKIHDNVSKAFVKAIREKQAESKIQQSKLQKSQSKLQKSNINDSNARLHPNDI